MSDISIHTINARGYIGFDILRDHFKISNINLQRDILNSVAYLSDILDAKGVQYSQLRSVLTPSLDKEDVCLLFDSSQIHDSWYGGFVFNKFFPLLNKKSNHTILCGDLICSSTKLANTMLKDTANLAKKVNISTPSQIYCVYISNISKASIESMSSTLQDLDCFIGYANMTYGSLLKYHLAMHLCNCCIKFGSKIICAHEDDRPNEENSNLVGYPYESYGYHLSSIQGAFYSPYLSYKIECPVLAPLKSDVDVSLNALSIDIKNLGEMEVMVESGKIGYLHKEKLGKLQMAGMVGITSEELARKIKEKINNSYIYGMTYLDNFNTMKFNTMLQFPHLGNGHPMRAVAALEYKPKDNVLRLITMT